METDYLSLHGISRRFGSIQALDDICMSVGSGEIVCLVGHSGCGKSTLLRVIAGVEKPDAGRIVLEGVEMSGPGRHVEPEDRMIGFMFQDYALFPHLNATDNILFGLSARLARADARVRCAEVIEQLGIGHLADRFPHMLSGGEQQRVALARALAPQPRILLMDEPFSNLDRGLRDGVRNDTLGVLRKLGTTVVMVTHDPEEALSAGDRVILMHAGGVAQSGTGPELYDRPSSQYVAEFFCSFNKVHAVCLDGFAETPLGRFKAPGIADGTSATVLIRPHGLSIDVAGAGVECTVQDCTLMGEIEQTRLVVPGIPEPLRVRSMKRSRLRAGDKVHVSVLTDEVYVFET